MPMTPIDIPAYYLEGEAVYKSFNDVKKAHPQTSFPDSFNGNESIIAVYPSPAPAFDPITQYVREIAPVLTVKGTYEQAYEVVDLDAETIAANQATAHRTTILNQISALESQVTQRRLREAVRGSGKAWLDNIDDQIALLRSQL